MQTPIDAFLDQEGISRAEVARWLGLDPSTVTRKVLGDREWKRRDINIFLNRAAERLGRPVSFEEAFGAPGPSADETPAAVEQEG